MNNLSRWVFSMQDYFLPSILVLMAVAALILLLLANSKRRREGKAQPTKNSAIGSTAHDHGVSPHVSTLSDVVFANNFDESISSIAASVNRELKGSVFIFRRDGDSASLVAYSSENPEKIATVLSKAGLKMNINAVPLQKERAKVFDLTYGEFNSPFQLIGDLTTSAACKKIQHDLNLEMICTTSAKTESSERGPSGASFLILLLQSKRSHDTKQRLLEFGSLLKMAIYLSNLKTKLSELENHFDEQFIRLKNELQKKESLHLNLFHGMPIAAAVLDERGVIIEASDRMRLLFPSRYVSESSGESLSNEAEAVGQPLTSIMGEDDRRNFIELLLNLQANSVAELNISLKLSGPAEAGEQLSERFFRLLLLKRRIVDPARGETSSLVVYFIDETAVINLKREYERTIDMLRVQVGSIEKVLSREKKYSEDIVRNAGVPIVVTIGDKVLLASERASEDFIVHENQPLEEFISSNEIFMGSESSQAGTFTEGLRSGEARASGGRTFIISQWENAGNPVESILPSDSERDQSIWFYTFNDVTELKKVEGELRKMTAESGTLFNSLLPTARVKYVSAGGGEVFVEWNNVFASLFKTFLESDKSFDGFLRYLGESPDSIKSELQSQGIIMRACRATDRKTLNLSASLVFDTVHGTEDSILIFIEDITDLENTRVQLRGLQNTFRNTIESFSEEPIFVVENGSIAASNLAARDKIGARIDEPFDFDDMLKRLGALSGGALQSETVSDNSIVELGGKFFRIESTSFGTSSVYHFRKVTDQIEQLAEIEVLRKSHELLNRLARSDRYENILANLGGILENAGTKSVKLVATGIIESDKESADVYLLTVSLGKIEPSLSLSLSPSDILTAARGGAFRRAELSDTTFANVLSGGQPALLIQTNTIGNAKGFASMALEDIDSKRANELGELLKAASSIAIGIHTRFSAERKFEESGKVTRALIGITGIDGASFAEISRKTVDLLKQVFGAEAVGLYSVEGTSLNSLAMNGILPEVISIPSLKFGMLMPAVQLDPSNQEAAQGNYFALKSRSTQAKSGVAPGLVLMFRFFDDPSRKAGVPPSPSELNAISLTVLDLLDSKRTVENQAASAVRLVDESKFLKDFMSGIAKAATTQDVLKILTDSLSRSNRSVRERDKSIAPSDDSAIVEIKTEGDVDGSKQEIVYSQTGGFENYEVNLLSLGIGIVLVKCLPGVFTRTMVELVVDKLKSFGSSRVQLLQNEAADLQAKLERANESHSRLRESVGKIPASLRSARIGIDAVLSKLAFITGDDRILQEIKLHLASAAKQLSLDMDNTYRNQESIFDSVRLAILESSQKLERTGDPARRKGASLRINDFNVSELTEFTADQTTSDLIKDLFVNFVLVSATDECEIMMMTAQPSLNESAEGIGKHISLRITSNSGEVLHDDAIKESASVRTLIGKLEKMGYKIDTRALGSELTMDICEIKKVETPGKKTLSALLVEDDKVVAYEESQKLIKIFSRVKVASDAVEAAMLFDSEKFDVAFVDLSLPSINGRELCRQIKSPHPDCKTILLTNREGEEKSDGVDYVMLRPLDEDAVRNYV